MRLWPWYIKPMDEKLFRLLQEGVHQLRQLVEIQTELLKLERKNDMPPAVIQALIDLLNKFVTLINTDATNLAASQAATAAAQASLDALTAQDSAAAALVPAAQAAIDAANAAVPAPPVNPA